MAVTSKKPGSAGAFIPHQKSDTALLGLSYPTNLGITCRVRFVASGSGSELILFDLRLLKPEEASSVKSNKGLLVLEALLPLPNFEWKTEDGRGHVTAFLPTTMAASAAGPT